MKVVTPPGLDRLLAALRQAGGRPFVVGGAVRDSLLELPIEDWDVEVFGLATEKLEGVLAAHGKVDAVGQSFRVYKISGVEGVSGVVDVSLPRRDSKVAPGHRGIAVTGDPHLPVEEAARRRDFTINALMLDTATGELLDPWGGQKDLQARLLRAVDAGTFGEDPLRLFGEMQNHVQRNGIEAAGGKRELIHVRLAHLAIRQRRARDVGQRHQQHLARTIDAHGGAHFAADELDDAARARADVEKVLHLGL